MEFTGELYFYYSDKSNETVINLLKLYADKIGYDYNYEINDLDEHSIMFFKNKKMWEYHLEHGYNVDLNGEGCFYINAKMVSLNGKASLYELNGRSNFDPTDTFFVFSKVPYYVLTVPYDIEEDPFSKKIYTDFYNILIMKGIKDKI